MLTAGFDAQRRDEAITLGVVAWMLKGNYPDGIDGWLRQIRTWYEHVGRVASGGSGGQRESAPS